MNCEKALPLLALRSAGSLDPHQDALLGGHLASCPKCSVAFVKTQKLRALLALKRHEQPDEFFYRTYLSRFHRKLCAEMVRRKTLWERVVEILDFDERAAGMLKASTALAGALAILLSLYAIQPGVRSGSFQQASSHVSPASQVTVPQDDLLFTDSSGRNTLYVLDRVPRNASLHETSVFTF